MTGRQAARMIVSRTLVVAAALTGYLVMQHLAPVSLRVAPAPTAGRAQHAAEQLQEGVQALTARSRCEAVQPGVPPVHVPSGALVYMAGSLRIVPVRGMSASLLASTVAWC